MIGSECFKYCWFADSELVSSDERWNFSSFCNGGMVFDRSSNLIESMKCSVPLQCVVNTAHIIGSMHNFLKKARVQKVEKKGLFGPEMKLSPIRCAIWSGFEMFKICLTFTLEKVYLPSRVNLGEWLFFIRLHSTLACFSTIVHKYYSLFYKYCYHTLTLCLTMSIFTVNSFSEMKWSANCLLLKCRTQTIASWKAKWRILHVWLLQSLHMERKTAP